MAKLSLIGLAVCCLLVAAHAQTATYNCDDARRIGNPSNNQCGDVCAEVIKQIPVLASMAGVCKSQCQQCVVAVSKCKLGAKQAMPQVCAQAFRIPAVSGIVNKYMGKTTTEKAPAAKGL